MQGLSLRVHHGKNGHGSHSYDANPQYNILAYNILCTYYKLKLNHFLMFGKFPDAEALEMLISMQEQAAEETTSGLKGNLFNRKGSMYGIFTYIYHQN